MFNRKDIKERAKALMKARYAEMFIAFLVCSIITNFIVCGYQTTYNVLIDDVIITEYIGINFGIEILLYKEIVMQVSFFILILALVLSIYKMSVGAILQTGLTRFFMLSENEEVKFSEIFYYFKQGPAVMFNIIKINFLVGIKSVLWMVLLIIPGIVKMLEYSMIPYLLVENPLASSKEIFAKSKRYTNGFKADIFVFYISFFGWLLLATIPFGNYLVQPYILQSEAYLYYDIKAIKEKEEIKI